MNAKDWSQSNRFSSLYWAHLIRLFLAFFFILGYLVEEKKLKKNYEKKKKIKRNIVSLNISLTHIIYMLHIKITLFSLSLVILILHLCLNLVSNILYK